MNVELDQFACGGHGFCAEVCPTLFEVIDDWDKATFKGLYAVLTDEQKLNWGPGVLNSAVPEGLEQQVEAAELGCPTKCIKVKQ